MSLRPPDLPILREFLEPGIDGRLTPAHDARSRATRLEQLVNHPELAERPERTARGQLLGQITWQRCAERSDSALAAD